MKGLATQVKRSALLRVSEFPNSVKLDNPARVLGYDHLNPKDVAKHQCRKEKLVRDAYVATCWEDRMLYLDVPLGAHEYNIYDLNKIMLFWDKFCKSPKQGLEHSNPPRSKSS